MYIIHIFMLCVVLLKLRMNNEIPRNFNMIPGHAYPSQVCPRAHLLRGLGLRWRCLDLESSLRMHGNPEFTLSEHIPSSGRMVQWQGALPLPATFQPQTHTVTGGGGASPQVLGSIELSLCTFDIWHLSCACNYDILHFEYVLISYSFVLDLCNCCIWFMH